MNNIPEMKKNFLFLCQQYNQLGLFLKLFVEVDSEAEVHQLFDKVIQQYHQIGEQLKILGFQLDDLGGDSIMIFQKEN